MTAAQQDDTPSVEARLAELLDQLGIAAAHFAGRGSADLKGFLSQYSGARRVADGAVPGGAGHAHPGAAGRAVARRDRRPRAGRAPRPGGIARAAAGHRGGARRLRRTDLVGHRRRARRQHRRGDAGIPLASRRPANGRPARAGGRDRRHLLSRARRRRAAGAAAARSVARAMGAADPGAGGALLHDNPRRRAARQRRQPRGARPLRVYGGCARACSTRWRSCRARACWRSAAAPA